MALPEVLGRRVEFEDGRIIFLGTCKDEPGVFFIGLRSKKGEDMKLRMSREAVEALVELFHNPMHGMPLADFPHKKMWRVVDYDEVEKVD